MWILNEYENIKLWGTETAVAIPRLPKDKVGSKLNILQLPLV